MKLKKTGKILKKSLIIFICIWLFLTQMPINNVFAEETNEEPPVSEIDNQEEQEPQETPEAQENSEEIECENPEAKPEQDLVLLTDNGESNETYVVDLYNGETLVSEVESFADAVDAVNNGDANKLVLLANISISESFTFNNDVIVDLNSKKIIVAQKNENITFKGSSSSIKNGTIAVSELGTSATKAVLVVDDNAELQIGQDAIIKSRVAFQLNDNAKLYVSDNAEINARNLIDTTYSTSNLYIEDQALLHLVGDVSESTGFGYWRSSGSAFNGTITITGGKFTNNQYPTYEGYTVTSKLKDYYNEEIYSDIELDDETYKYQVIKGGGITFDVQGGTWTEGFEVPYYYEYEKGLTLPISENISRAGYTFNGWLLNNEPIIEIAAETTGNYDVVASWTANDNTPYVVKHIYELENGEFPTEVGDNLVILECFGITDTEVTPDFIGKDGYSFPNRQTKKIAGDGSTVFEIYYRLGASELAIYSENDNKGTVAIEDKTGTAVAIEAGVEVTIIAAPTIGYKFARWVNTFDNEEIISEESSYTFTMANSSISYTAIFEPDKGNSAWAIKVSVNDVTRASNICYQEGDCYFYQSISDAVEFAKNGAVVDLIGDITVNESAVIENQITINLNNHNITQPPVEERYEASNQILMISSNGNLTLNGPGEIKSEIDDEYGYYQNTAIYNNGGVLSLDDGVVVETTGRNASTIRGNNGIININDASIISNIVALSLKDTGVEINEGAKIENTSEKREKYNSYYYSLYRQSLIFLENSYVTTININGGELTSTSESMFGADYSWGNLVTVKGGVLNPSDSGFISAYNEIFIEFRGGTVNSNNYLFDSYSGIIYSGYFNIKNGISTKKYSNCVYGGKYHVYYNDPSKINALAYGYSVVENEDEDNDKYEYTVLSKSNLTFDSNTGYNRKFTYVQAYKTKLINEDLLPEDPSWAGYSFEGWYFDTSYTEKFDPDTFIPSEDSYKLYAKWALNPNDSIWAVRLKTSNINLDATRKYFDNSDMYYYYMLDENNTYETGDDFVKAFSDASDNDTIELLKNVTLQFDTYYYRGCVEGIKHNNITFDLKNHKLTFTKDYLPMFNFDNTACTKFTLKNGTVYYQSSNSNYSKTVFESLRSQVEVVSINVNYGTNFEVSSYYRVILSGHNIKTKIQGGSVSSNICLIDSFYSSESVEVVNGYTFKFAGEDFNYIKDAEGYERVQLKGGIYKYDPDPYAADGFVSSEHIQTIDDIEYNYEIVPGYKVYFDFNDKVTEKEKVNVPTTQQYVLETQIPEIPERTGYEFIGWYTEKNGGTKIDYVATYQINKDTTLYAHWQTQSYTITFDLNGGQGEAESITVNYKGKYPELPAPTKTGYYFSGWYTIDEPVSQGTAYPSKIEKGCDVLITEDTTLHAHWSTKTITVLLDCNGGFCHGMETSSDEYVYTYFSLNVNYNSTYPINEQTMTPEREGYVFDGWFTAKTGGNKVDKDTIYADYPAETLYAHWSNATYKLVLNYLYQYDDHSGHGDNDKYEKEGLTSNVSLGDELLTPTIDITDTYFVGWNRDSSGNGEWITKDTIINYNGSNYDLYAIYDQTNYDYRSLYLDYGYNKQTNGSILSPLNYNLSSSPAPTKLSEYYGNDGGLPQPERSGYIFSGWKIGDTAINDDTLLDSVFSESERYKVATAQWTIDTTNGINATFYANGGEFGTDGPNTQKISQILDSTYTLPSTNPTREGYSFAGWVLMDGYKNNYDEHFNVNNFKDIVTSSSVVKEEDCYFQVSDLSSNYTKEILVYAMWKPATIKYTVYHKYINPGHEYSGASYGGYYTDDYLLKDTEEYEVDNNSYVLIKPKEFDGVTPFGSTFDYSLPVHITADHEAYSVQESDQNYDPEKPYIIYYTSNEYNVIVDYNADGNYKIEQQDEWIIHRSYQKKYRDTFSDARNGDPDLYYVHGENGSSPYEGYTFVKWVDDDRNDIIMFNETSSQETTPNPTFMPAEDFTVHAIWKPITYTIKYEPSSYDSELVEGEMADQTVTYGTKNDKLSKNQFTKEGYDFVGWTRSNYQLPSADYSDEQLIDPDFTSISNESVTLYPVWEPKEYTVTYHFNGGEKSPYSSVEVVIVDDCATLGATYGETWNQYWPVDFVKDGYDTGCWYADFDNDYPTDGTEEDKNEWYETHPDYNITEETCGATYQCARDLDVYLRWKPREFVFNFNTNCSESEVVFESKTNPGSEGTREQEITEKFNEKIVFPKFFIRTQYGDETPRPGFDFDGWYFGTEDPITSEWTEIELLEGTVIDTEFYNKYLSDGSMGMSIYPKWKKRKDVKYKINIYLAELSDNMQDSEPTFPEDPFVTYEMTGSPFDKIDLYELLSHKKYQYKGFYLHNDGSSGYFENDPYLYQDNSGRYESSKYELDIKPNSVMPDGSTIFNVKYLRNAHNIYAYFSRSDITIDEYGQFQENGLQPIWGVQYEYGLDWDDIYNNYSMYLPDELKNDFDWFVVYSPASIQELPNKMPDSDLVVLTARKSDKFEITFDANGGTFKDGFITRSITQYYDTLFNVPLDIPQKDGYAFDGWYLDDGTKIERKDGYYVSFRGERTAKAHWTKPLVEVSIEDEESNETEKYIYSNLEYASNKINEEYNRKVTIKLLIDATVHDNAEFICEDITFDLNGHTIFYETNGTEDFITFTDSNVTITDSTSNELGKISSNARSTIYLSNSSFTMDSGTIENQSTESGCSVLYINNNFSDCYVNIIGGSILYTNDDFVTYNPVCIHNENASSVIIGSGTSRDSGILISLPDSSTSSIFNKLNNVTIKGGKFVARSGSLGIIDISDNEDGTNISSGFFELYKPLAENIDKKEIFTGGYFNIENIDSMNLYIPKGKVIINSFGGYYGNNSYLYFYEIGDEVDTIVHFIITDPEGQEDSHELMEVQTKTGVKIANIEGLSTPEDTENYHFVGWTSSPDGKNQVTIVSNSFEHNLYTLWIKKTHTLKFTVVDKDKGIAEQNISSRTLNILSGYPELPGSDAVERTNPKYKFAGWLTSTNKLVKAGDPFEMKGIVEDDDIVLHAKWVDADVYLIKMNSVLEGSDTVKSIANLSCSNNVVYEDTDGNEIKAVNEDEEKYSFLYWKINDYVAKYDQTSYKWNIIENYGEQDESIINTINVGEAGNAEVLASHYIELNFDLFAKEGSKDIDIYAVYDYIGEHKSLLTVEGHKSFKVEVENKKVALFGLLSETEKLTYDAVLDPTTQLYTVEAIVDIGSTVRTIYDNDTYKDFSSWVKSTNIILSNKPTLEFSIVVDTNIKLITKSDNGELGDGSYHVIFRNNSGLLINSTFVTRDNFDSVIERTMIPSLTGWTFRYWSLDYEHEVNFDAIEDAAGDNKNTVTLRPIYKLAQNTQKTTVYIYTVDGGQISEYKVLNDQQVGSSFYINAPKLEGKTFSYWTKEDGTILGYTNTYALTLVDCIEYKYYAHYDEEEFTAKPVITLNGIVKETDVTGEMESQIESHKIVYSIARSLPTDYELLEQGILYSTSSIFATMDEKTLDYNFRFDIADVTGWALKPNVKAYIGSHKDAVNVLTVRFDRTGKEDTTIYLRGYVIYKSKVDDSKPQIMYTNVDVQKFNEEGEG